MSDITYNYEIIKVDKQSKCMEVVYSSPGKPTLHIGARLPYVGETLDSIIQMYSPVRMWEEQEAQVQDVAVGLTGSWSPATPTVTLESTKKDKLAEIAAWRYQRETSGVRFNGTTIATDRQSQAQVTSAFISLSQGLVQSVQWKGEDGVWVTLNLPEITAIAGAVAAHVQGCFADESAYADQVNACTTIDQVNAIVLPANTIPVVIL